MIKKMTEIKNMPNLIKTRHSLQQIKGTQTRHNFLQDEKKAICGITCTAYCSVKFGLDGAIWAYQKMM